MATVVRLVSIELNDEDGESDPVTGSGQFVVEVDVGDAEKKAGAGLGRVRCAISVLRSDMPTLRKLIKRNDHAVLDNLPDAPDVKK